MTVYVLSSADYGDFDVLSVHLTIELAEAEAKRLMGERDYRADPDPGQFDPNVVRAWQPQTYAVAYFITRLELDHQSTCLTAGTNEEAPLNNH